MSMLKKMSRLSITCAAAALLLLACRPPEETDDAGNKDAAAGDAAVADTFIADNNTVADAVTRTDAQGQDQTTHNDAATNPDQSGTDATSNDASEVVSVSVNAVQDESNANHPDDGTDIRLEGVIVTAVDNGGNQKGFWVQDAEGSQYSGIYVFKPGPVNVDLTTLSEGDVVTVIGKYVEYHELSEIMLSSFEKTGTHAPLEPIVVTDLVADAEIYEGMLVRQCGPCVVSELLEHGEVATNCVRLDDELYFYTLTVGQSFECVTGVMHYSFDNFKLLPRRAADLGLSNDDAGVNDDAHVAADANVDDAGGEDVSAIDAGSEDVTSTEDAA